MSAGEIETNDEAKPTATKRSGEQIFGWIAAIGCGIAGIYLLTSQSASADTTVFDAMMHGIGIYFLARGAWMISRLVASRS